MSEVERIVREVLSELGVGPAPAARGLAPAASGPAPAASGLAPAEAAPVPDQPVPASGELVLTARVITLGDVLERLGTARRLVVPRRAIVTPAVVDELRRRNVTLTRAAAAQRRQSAAARIVLVAVPARHEPATLVAALQREGLSVERHALDCLIVATDRLAAELTKPDTLGVLWTRHTAAGLCLANRHPGVRAVLATEPAATTAAVAAVGANLLVLGPSGQPEFQQKQILAEFGRGGVRPCPETFSNRLG
ncbi:MAG: hypothetical protein ABSF26_03245 [Thermoguttaceae bacterium]